MGGMKVVEFKGVDEKLLISHRLLNLFMPVKMIAGHPVNHSSHHHGP
jgi:hypothetical protein